MEDFKFSVGGTRDYEVQLWSMVYAAAVTFPAPPEDCAKCADMAVQEFRKRL